jgi:hypothetical protein
MFYESPDYEDHIKLINEGKMNINELCETDRRNLMAYSFRKAIQDDENENYNTIEINCDDKRLYTCRETDLDCLCHYCNCN